MNGEAMEHANPLGVLEQIGWRVVWLDKMLGDVWIVDECKVILADDTLSPRRVADVLWQEVVERLRA